jgi:soluble lytic murein transglycosylase-like protein
MDNLLTFDKLVEAVIQRESSGRPDVVSKGGAVGLMGIMPKDFMQSPRKNVPSVFDAARELGFEIAPEQENYETAVMLLKDPEINTILGETYLKELMSKYRGDTEASLTAYNAGPKKYDLLGSAEAMDIPEQREYSRKVSKDYKTMFGNELPENLGVLVSPRPRPRPKGLLD